MKSIYVLFLLSLSHFCAEANYELHVRVHSYSHLNSQRDWQGNHCDPLPNDPCENYFLFCLQSHGWSQTSSFCLYGFYDSISSPITSSSATFSDGQNIFAPGIDNPMIFRGEAGTAWIQRFQFQIRVQDYDPLDSHDLIDRVFVISNGLAISDTFTAPQTYTGIYNNVQAVVSYKAVCQTNYYGSLCTVFCRGRNDTTGRYECNSEGQPVCLEGWTDTATNCLTPICTPSCPTNSECTAPNQCICLQGWSGDSCDQCVPATGCVHGSCVNPGECVCDTGYSGTLCNIDDDVCGHQSPCMNNGTCSNTGPDSHTCACPPQFNGPNCESDVDECTSNPCLNGAMCLNHHGSFSCLCVAGYTGQDCGTEIDECSSSPCQNGGSCLDLLDDFNCTCPAGFTGAVCDINIDDCHRDLCLHGGTCVDQVDGYTCDCLPRYTGSQCESEKPSPCSSSPCSANTFCVEDRDANTFTCEECQPGFESCDTIVIVDPDAQQQGKNGTDVQPVNGMLIGGVIGGVVGALLLLCLVIAMVILCVKWCTCCPCVKLKHTDVDQYQTIGGGARHNPLYFGTSTLLSSQSGTLRSSSNSMPHYDGTSPHYAELSTVASSEDGVDFAPAVRQHSNPMYALAQAQIYNNGTPPSLPAPRKGSVGRPVSPSHSSHYERLPGDIYNSPPPQEIVTSGKYDCLKPEAGPQMVTSGKYDSLAAPSTSAKDNPYIIDRGDGYKVLPGNPRPAVDDSKPLIMTNEMESTPLPTTNFNPYN